MDGADRVGTGFGRAEDGRHMSVPWARDIESQTTLVGVGAKYPLHALETSITCDISARKFLRRSRACAARPAGNQGELPAAHGTTHETLCFLGLINSRATPLFGYSCAADGPRFQEEATDAPQRLVSVQLSFSLRSGTVQRFRD
jgi:hypothetical protein